tara:strand:- start:236 stop:1312 length:1077 start_codon:yes stop_codon:yes gene_type:complete
MKKSAKQHRKNISKVHKYPISFVHLGLSKCMSSSLQEFWNTSHNYCLYQGHDFNEAIEKTIVHHKHNAEEVLLSASFNFQSPPNSDDVTVFSSERLSTLWPTDLEKQEFWDIKQTVLPKLFSNYTRRVLLVVRDPIDWIFSDYAQLIKEGRNLEFDAYLSEYRDYIEQILNLRFVIDQWQKSGVEVSVIPIELSTSDKEAFWRLYESLLEVQRPSNWDDHRLSSQRDVTNHETLSMHLQLNKLMELLEESVNQNYRENEADIEDLRSTAALMKQWGSRRALSGADQDQLSKIRHLLSPDIPSLERASLALPPALGETIASNFIEPLRGLTGWENLTKIKDQYKQSIETSTRPIPNRAA